MSKDFPWDEPQPTEDLPRMDSSAAKGFDRDADVLNWFCRNRGSGGVDSDAPLYRWIQVLRSCATTWPPSPSLLSEYGTVAPLTTSPWLPLACDIYLACLAAFAVRRVEGAKRSGRVGRLEIDASFVGGELARRDDTDLKRFSIPAGVGTLLTAADCARVGAKRLDIKGAQSKSLDIVWERDDDTLIWFECKSRSLASAFDARSTPSSIVRSVIDRVASAAPALRARAKSEKAHALQVTVVSGAFPSKHVRGLETYAWDKAVAAGIYPLGPYRGPHAVMLQLFGLGIGEGAVDPRTIRQYFTITDTRPRTTVNAVRSFQALAVIEPTIGLSPASTT